MSKTITLEELEAFVKDRYDTANSNLTDRWKAGYPILKNPEPEHSVYEAFVWLMRGVKQLKGSGYKDSEEAL